MSRRLCFNTRMVNLYKRKPWVPTQVITLIGPGAAGKSSLGLALAPLIDYEFIDLDDGFNYRISNIGEFIRSHGYQEYKVRNSALAAELAADARGNTLLVASSGFLTPDNPQEALFANQNLVESSYSICLLPSLDVERSVTIIVERQMARPFASTREREEKTIRDRHPIYARLGDLGVFSTEHPRAIAAAIANHLSN